MLIELNDVEQRLAKYLAKRRYDMNRDNKIKNQRIGPQSDDETDLEGIGAELAFCRAFNVYPDLTLNKHPEEDAILRNGMRVDCKATRYKNGHLLAVITKAHKPADLYVLVVGEFPKYRIAGFATAEEIFQEQNIHDFGHGPTYAIPQNKLTSAKQLLIFTTAEGGV